MSANKHQHDQVWKNWNTWYQRALTDLHVVHHDREMFTEVRDAIVAAAPQSPDTWLAHYARCYVAKQAMAIRRIMDTDARAESFGRLLQGVETSPQVFSRARFMHAENVPDERDRETRRVAFEAIKATNGDWVGPEYARTMRARLEQETAKLVRQANLTIAHPDKRTPDFVTWAELNQTIDHVGAAVVEFGSKLTGVTNGLVPVVLGDWQEMFREPLFPKLPRPDGGG